MATSTAAADTATANSRVYSLLDGRLPAGVTLNRAVSGGNTWCQLDGTSFQVRCGPNYKKMKGKKSSGPELFKFIGADCFSSPSKYIHIMQHIALPPYTPSSAPAPTSATASEGANGTTDAKEKKTDSSANGLPAGVLPYFVVNFMLPAYAPANPIWGATVEDGIGYSLVLYFVINERTKEAMCGPSPSAAIQLLQRFLSGHPRGSEVDEIRRRLKCIPRLANSDEVNLGLARSIVNSYNAKPFMTGPRCHTFYKGPDYLEVDVDVHRFSYVARKGAWSMWECLPEMALDIGFVVEADGEEEMPEQVFGSARVGKLQNTAKSLMAWKQGASVVPVVPAAAATAPVTATSEPTTNGVKSDDTPISTSTDLMDSTTAAAAAPPTIPADLF